MLFLELFRDIPSQNDSVVFYAFFILMRLALGLCDVMLTALGKVSCDLKILGILIVCFYAVYLEDRVNCLPSKTSFIF